MSGAGDTAGRFLYSGRVTEFSIFSLARHALSHHERWPDGPHCPYWGSANVQSGAKVFTDDASAYEGMPFDHEAVNHSAGEHVRGMAHTNGVESFWSMLKRGHQGTFHYFSEKHLDRYVNGFTGRHNDRESDTVNQMANATYKMIGKRITYLDLVG